MIMLQNTRVFWSNPTLEFSLLHRSPPSLSLFFSNSGGLRRGFMGRQVGQAVGMAREGSVRVLAAVEAARPGQG